ncbi:hypothetical protein LDL76_12475 [Salegentibacter mishustinae]|uniref:hypothetical protein n=1 Tax=Salegentibacter mishustinae TaxID=270918 RepID=UPI001CE1C84E|nr:hypothetical protein [Salegentibacter mishustinae]UBZ06173.1 hypothetical protein LDL76_12475 [Salegentibacter mishustinae]
MTNDFFIKQTEDIITEYQALKRQSQYDDFSDLGEELVTKLITKAKSVVVRIVGNKSEYYLEIQSTLEKNYLHVGNKLNYIIGSVGALKEDLENDYLKSYSELLHSDIFSDYIEIATHLLDKGYKDSSAVIIGSTLESHLRQLCEKFQISVVIEKDNGKQIHKKADRMNADLTKEEAYSKSYQKQIIAWLDIRNNSAHGKYDEYSEQEVKLMILGVQNFILNFPA